MYVLCCSASHVGMGVAGHADEIALGIAVGKVVRPQRGGDSLAVLVIQTGDGFETVKLDGQAQEAFPCGGMSVVAHDAGGGEGVLTSKNEAGPQENDITPGIVEVGSREEGRHRSCQDANRAQLESPEHIHVDHACVSSIVSY